MKHFLRDDDLDAAGQAALLDLAAAYKAAPREGRLPEGGAVAMIFEKESTRTRLSFEVGIAQLGAHPVVVDARSSQLANGESVADTARVLSRYVDAIVLRTFGDDRLAAFADAAEVPVVNALTDGFHPCQLLADLLTVREEFGSVAGRVVAYLGDGGSNTAHSHLLAFALAGARLRLACPAGHRPDAAVLADARALAARHGADIVVTDDVTAAVDGADVVATDTWVSMGRTDRAERLAALAPYRLTASVLDDAAPHAIALHCLPAHRGEEITDEVMDGPRSRVFAQAGNRLPVQKALLRLLLTGSGELAPPVAEVV